MAQITIFNNTDGDPNNDLPTDISDNLVLQALAGAATTAGTTIYQPGSTLSYFFGDSTDSFFQFDEIIVDSGHTGQQVDFLFQEEVKRSYDSASLFANIDFEETSNQNIADISLYAAENLSDPGVGFLNGLHTFPGGVNVNATDFRAFGILDQTNSNTGPEAELGGGNFRSRTVLHETGHGLGLGHTFDDDNGSTVLLAADPLQNERYTVMSRSSDNATPGIFTFGHAVSYMALDIAALQALYGADNTAHLGTTTYSLTDAQTTALDLDGSDGSISIGRAYYSIWDAGGDDEVAYGGTDRVLLNLNDATLQTSLDPIDDADLLALISDVQGSAAFATLGTNVQTEITDQGHTAGGFFSSIIDSNGNSVDGGYTIANGAVIENATGGSGDDLLIGNEADNVLTGNAGDDALFGGAGNDTLDGSAGNDILSGGTGTDVLDGGVGEDTADFSGASSATTVVLFNRDGVAQQTFSSGIDTLIDIENITGSEFNDRLIGDAGSNVIRGSGGNDTIDGVGGGDFLFGGAGNDGFRARGGDDVFDGGDDIDFVNYDASTGVNAFLDGSGTNGRAAVGDAFINIENLIGSDTGNDLLFGDAGANRLTGNGGDDLIRGRAGVDQLEGGAGDDTLIGDEGADVYVTGAGADTIVFNQAPDAANRDRITDFTSGEDILQIDASVFGGGLVAGDTVNLIANSNPFAITDDAAFLFDIDNGTLRFDADGDGASTSEFFALLQGVSTLLASDFDLIA